MECTQVLISSPSRDIIPCEKKQNRIVAKLTINGITHDIFNRENTIGRGDSCNIILKNEAISSRHAIIEANDCEEHILYDLGSTNKTKLGKTTLKPNVRYFINDGANLTFADELAVYKYVSNSPKHQETRNFTIPATPEKSETSRLSSPEVSEIKDDDIIDSSDIDIFDESFEEEISKKRKVNRHSLKIKEEIMNDDDIYRIADKKSESHHTENSKFTTIKNKEITSLHNLNETLTSENLSENKTLKGYRLGVESVAQTCLSIYDIPTQTISENGDLFEETNKTTFEVETQQHILNSRDAEGREKEFEQISHEDKEKKDISDIQEADTLDPTDCPLIWAVDMDCSEKTLSAIVKEKNKHLEVKEHELKEVMYFDDDELNFKGRKVNEMNTQDMLCKSRDMDSDDEIEEIKAVSVNNKMNNQPISPKKGDIKFTASSTLDEKSIADKIIEVDNSESTWSTENKIGLDLLCDKECPDNNDRNNLSLKEDNIFSKDSYIKYQYEKLDKDVFKLVNQKASSCKSVDNLFDNKEGDEENINYKEKKIKLSQMMKLSSESAISQRDATVRSTLDSDVDNSLSELLIQPVNQNVMSTSKENNIFSDKSSVSQKKNTDHEDPALLINLSLSNMQIQSVESNSRPSPNLGSITSLCKTKSEFESVDEEKVNVIASSMLNKSNILPNDALKSLNDSYICNLMTQPVLNAEVIHDKEEVHFGKKKKYTELPNKAEDMVPEKEELSKSKTAKFEEENDIKSFDDMDICDLMTQPILITEEVQSDKIYGKEKELEILNKAEDTRPEKEVMINARKAVLIKRQSDENRTNETNICDLKTQPFLTTENLGNKEENKIFGTEKEIKSLLSEVEPFIPEIKKATKARETAIIEEKTSQNDTDICDLVTQPIIIVPEDLHDKEENKICSLEKEIKSSNKTEVEVPERELAKARKTSKEGEKSDQKSLTHICDLMTAPVVITPKNGNGGNKVCRREKEVESPSKPFYGFHKNGNENEEVDVSTMLTQPVLLSDENFKDTNQQTSSPNKSLSNEENMNDSMDNMLTQAILLPNQFCTSGNANDTSNKQIYSSKNLVAGENQRMCNTSLNDLSFSSMLTQPILPPDVKHEQSDHKDIVNVSVINIKMETEIKKNVSVDNLANSEHSSNNCGYLKASTLTNDKIDQNLNEESISGMLTQPVILEDDVSHQNIKERPDEEIDSVKIFSKREDLLQSSFNKKETDSIAFNTSKAELSQKETSPSIIENNSAINNSHREEMESVSKDYSNMLTKPFKKKFSKQVIASRKYTESEVTLPSNISDNEKSTNKIMNEKEFKECEGQVKENCSSNHYITSPVDNQAVLIIPKKRKNITLRLKKDKEKKPSDIDSIRKESLIIALESINKGLEVNLAHSDNITDIDIPGGKVAKLQKLSKLHRVPVAEEAEKGENEINILENRSISDEHNSASCKGPDINSGKNFSERSIGVPESNNKVIEPISRKNISINTFTSVISNDTNDIIEGKKLQPEMGRGKRRRTKKIFQDFCTDDNLEKIVSDDLQENSQNRRTKNDALDGNNSNAESQKILGADRKRKSSKNNQEEELKSEENICRPHLKKKCIRLLDSSSSIAAERGNSVDINLKETSLGLLNKKEENENIGKNDQNAISESDSTIETSGNLLTHIECVNLGLLESSNCFERWNSPLNTTKMRTYSKKKSLITFAGEQSNSSSLRFNEGNKNINTEDRAIVKDSSFPTGSAREEVKNRSSISESKVSFLPVIISSKRNSSNKTNAPKTKALVESDDNSNSNDNVLKREHEEDNTKLSRNNRRKTKKIDNAPNDNKKSTVSPSKPKATANSEFIKQHISPVVKLKRYIHSEHVQISVKDTSKDKEISSITSRNQRKTKHSREAKKDDEPFNEEEQNFPKSSTPIKLGGSSSMPVIDQNIEAEKSFAASFSFNKSDESSPARRSGRKRKLNCRLQPFFGPCENVMFTGYSDPKALAIINKLGGQVVDCPKSCTVLVTDKVRRTVKFLCALALGRPIVSPQWLASSKMSLTFLDHNKYLLKDKEAEKQFSFTLKESLAKARKTPLLQGKSIFVTNCVKPPPVDMKSIVECSGGTFLTKAPTIWPQNSVIISCNEDKSVCNKFRKKQSNLRIVSAEFVLSGILQQDFNPDKYIL